MPLAGQIIRALDFPPTIDVEDGTNILNVSNTVYAAGSPELGIPFVAPTGGRVKVEVFSIMRSDGTNTVFVNYEVRLGSDASGPIVQGAADANATQLETSVSVGSSSQSLVQSLIPGVTYFIRALHRVTAGNTADIFHRRLTISPQS